MDSVSPEEVVPIEEIAYDYKNYDKELIKYELLKNSRILGPTNGTFHTRTFYAHDSPDLMDFIGIIRELSFRGVGGGTGKSRDINDFDTGKGLSHPFEQLIIIRNEDMLPVGGYRLIEGNKLRQEDGSIKSPTQSLFKFSDKFIERYLDQSLELGRSFVYSGIEDLGLRARQEIGTLDFLMRGLGAKVIDTDKKYLFGKVTRIPDPDEENNNIIQSHLHEFLMQNNRDYARLMRPYEPIGEKNSRTGINYKNLSVMALKKNIKNAIGNFNVPPMLSVYLKMTYEMKSFGTAKNGDFGEEIGIMVNTLRLYKSALEKYVKPYIDFKKKTEPALIKHLNNVEKKLYRHAK